MTRLSKALIALLSVVFIALGIAAYGGDDDDDSGGGARRAARSRSARCSRTSTTHAEPDDPGLPGPAARLHAAEHLQARRGEGRDGHPRARRVPARGHERRQDVQAQASIGTQVQRRHPDQGQRLREHHQAPSGLRRPFSSFVTGIEGTDKLKSCDDDVEGIVTDDKTGDITITLRLRTPSSRSPCPRRGRLPLRRRSPRARAGESAPAGIRARTLEDPEPLATVHPPKNPDFDFPGIAARSTRSLVKSSVSKMTQDVIDGNLDFMTEDPSGDQLPQVRRSTPIASRSPPSRRTSTTSR